jgi:CSLREA domain-containing protein
LVSVLVAVLAATGPLMAVDWTVDSLLDQADSNPGDGACSAISSGSCTLRAAIQESNATSGADRILLPAGTFTLSIAGKGDDTGATGDLDVFDHLEIVGAGSGLTTIDASSLDRVMHLHNANAIYPAPSISITGVTLTGGDATVLDGFLGGGLFAESLETLSLDDVHVVGNSANQGGGIHLLGGNTTMNRCSVRNNTAVDAAITNRYGDGLYASSAEVEIKASTFSGNQGSHPASAALHLHGGGPVSIINSTVTANGSNGIRAYNNDTQITQSTIVGNGTNGISFGSYDGTDTLLLANSVLAGNASGSCSITSGVYTHSGNVEDGDSCSLSTASGELINTDPMLAALSLNGGTTECFAPLPGSPVIDLLPITDPYIQWEDQRGVRRPQDGNSDGQDRYDAGSVESTIIFVDGFETSDTSRWSSAVPFAP